MAGITCLWRVTEHWRQRHELPEQLPAEMAERLRPARQKALQKLPGVQHVVGAASDDEAGALDDDEAEEYDPGGCTHPMDASGWTASVAASRAALTAACACVLSVHAAHKHGWLCDIRSAAAALMCAVLLLPVQLRRRQTLMRRQPPVTVTSAMMVSSRLCSLVEPTLWESPFGKKHALCCAQGSRSSCPPTHTALAMCMH